ncbi:MULTISPECIES: lactonase family protein [unclassified Pseudomonas]|uniref:lactonase family protein n=1 Tax=unclassified Pseudomonas TaxID=196821 RepID=UPI000BD38721|nr:MULTISPECIES: lactonase family protein [unclassified Pseudomonas]PVZ20503.1 6-phosphogluconolactonase [Pseudomonas sp. URIL14HWK12:I12]PVZ27569.1 6-phosphogluconolactonase [Pseudomonas sp. URIL14HWK12:I10]PVZ38458.1 6-phosphogluconolactonase [Pseudomonas sp. URIL14HWK12:I11]SNZ03275.1 6-phosphogluconolactonase [Pseudomonas sp. URIL14HWK12:I9]
MRTPLLLAAAVASFSLQAHAMTYAYISSPLDGLISQYHLDDDTGALSLVEQTHAGDQVNPMALSPDGKALYAALRAKPYTVKSYRIAPGSGHLEENGQAPLAESLAYLATDRSGRWLLGASYGADLLTTQAIGEGYRPASTWQTFKTGPHAHSVRTDPSNHFAYAGNLGNDHLLQYRFDAATGSLMPVGTGFVTLPDKTGPRHIAFSTDGRFVYVVGEMSGTVTGYAIDPQTGALKAIGSANGIPASLGLVHGEARDASNNNLEGDPTPRIWAADLRLSPDGKLLYMTERTSSSVSAFTLGGSTGEPTFVGNYPVEEKQPRNIAFAPNGRWLLVTGEKSATVGSYAIGPKGSLQRVSEAASGKGALWIEVWQTKS